MAPWRRLFIAGLFPFGEPSTMMIKPELTSTAMHHRFIIRAALIALAFLAGQAHAFEAGWRQMTVANSDGSAPTALLQAWKRRCSEPSDCQRTR